MIVPIYKFHKDQAKQTRLIVAFLNLVGCKPTVLAKPICEVVLVFQKIVSISQDLVPAFH